MLYLTVYSYFAIALVIIARKWDWEFNVRCYMHFNRLSMCFWWCYLSTNNLSRLMFLVYQMRFPFLGVKLYIECCNYYLAIALDLFLCVLSATLGVFDCRWMFQRVILPLSVISTGLCCLLPEANAFVLMMFGGPIICLLFDEYKRYEW